MAFILSDDRTSADAVRAGFARYRAYLAQNRQRFPAGAYELASSEWHFHPRDPRSPHDAWLERFELREDAAQPGSQEKRISLIVNLVGPYDQRQIEYCYREVTRYTLVWAEPHFGHRNWRYDEFRLSDNGQLIHEIEWWGPAETGRWLIEAADLQARYAGAI